ncbi:MAG: hypothetical protein EBY17_26990, partial [Acidobacteriia bacterium]|nr:hypothetical protein [Terriglobia bacterium]
MKIAVVMVLGGLLALAGEKKLPSGEASNEAVGLQATVLDDEQLQQIFSSDFSRMFVVVEVTLMPKSGKTLDIRLDDFLVRSEQSGYHTGPLMAAQIGGEGGIVVKRPDPSKRRG